MTVSDTENKNMGADAEVAQKPSRSDKNSSERKKVEPKAPPIRRWIWIIAFASALGGIGLLGWYFFVRGDSDETYLELMGNIDVRQVNLAFKVEGRIDTLAVDEGNSVKAGDILATLDTILDTSCEWHIAYKNR